MVNSPAFAGSELMPRDDTIDISNIDKTKMTIFFIGVLLLQMISDAP